jgi:ADP-heptose:LPS heptosyltransferase
LPDTELTFQNIVVVDLGQLGDVVLSLPALAALRLRFPDSHIAVLTGKPPESVIKLSGLADETLSVDRVALRDGPKLRSIKEILRLVAGFRRRRIDLLIDLHSLSETNLLAFLSRARYRLLANRENRSLDRLTNFQPRPPIEDKSKHLAEKYLDVLRPLGIADARMEFQITAPVDEIERVRDKYFPNMGERTVGLFPGAGHSSRRWDLEKFGELASRLGADGVRTAVFLGPEEVEMKEKVRSLFPKAAVVIDDLLIPGLAAAARFLSAVVTNDTGTMHLSAFAGAPILLLLDLRAPDTYLPLTEKLSVLRADPVGAINVDEAYAATTSLMSRFRPLDDMTKADRA